MSFDDLIPVRTFVNGIEADIARSALEAAGIHAVIRRDDCGGVRPSLWMAGIQLLVRREDAAVADSVLETPALYAADVTSDPVCAEPSVYDFTAKSIDGRDVPLDVYRGRVLLIVNVASRCGFTPQYEGLEQLHRAYGDRGFVVLGFPCNQFGRQEPGTNEEISEFCTERYDVTFPMFAKIDVNGERTHLLFAFLKSARRGWFGGTIRWNFTKFLVDRRGHVVERYGPTDAPAKIEPDIVRALDQSEAATA
jgi:glutathione peroxidase